jgi:SET domain-containing protein 6
MLVEGLQHDSIYRPYLDILPRHLDSLIFWSEKELAELQASMVVKKIGKQGAEDMFSKYIAPIGLSGVNTENCHLAASIIMAYAFDIPERTTPNVEEYTGGEEDDLVSDHEDDEKTILSMVPLADML